MCHRHDVDLLEESYNLSVGLRRNSYKTEHGRAGSERRVERVKFCCFVTVGGGSHSCEGRQHLHDAVR